MDIKIDYIRNTVTITITMAEEEVAPSVEVIEKADAPIQMIPVKSSNIAKVGYRVADGTLQVQFKGGRSYQYLNVPEYVWDSFMIADSKGSFFAAEIKLQYDAITLDN